MAVPGAPNLSLLILNVNLMISQHRYGVKTASNNQNATLHLPMCLVIYGSKLQTRKIPGGLRLKKKKDLKNYHK